LKNIEEAKPKYYHSEIQEAALALRCEVLGCCSRGELLSLLPILRLAIGPHPIDTAVTIPWHLCTQLKSPSKARATKAQQDGSINVAINS
jgi:hypothetical protein